MCIHAHVYCAGINFRLIPYQFINIWYRDITIHGLFFDSYNYIPCRYERSIYDAEC